MSDTFWYGVSAVAGAVTAGGAIFGFLWHKFKPVVVATRQIFEHIVGIKGNPITDTPEVPGLFPRITAIEQTIKLLSEDMKDLKHEIYPNSGSSMRDQTDRAVELSQQALDVVQRLESQLLPKEEE